MDDAAVVKMLNDVSEELFHIEKEYLNTLNWYVTHTELDDRTIKTTRDIKEICSKLHQTINTLFEHKKNQYKIEQEREG